MIESYVSQILNQILPCGKPIRITIEGNRITLLVEWPGEHIKQLRIEREIDLNVDDPVDGTYFGMRMAKDIRFLEKLDAPTMLESAFEFDPNQD